MSQHQSHPLYTSGKGSNNFLSSENCLYVKNQFLIDLMIINRVVSRINCERSIKYLLPKENGFQISILFWTL